MAKGEKDFSRAFWRSASVAPVEFGAHASGEPCPEEFRLLADNIPTLCWISNGDGYITWYNRRWHEYCGTSPEEMEGWGWQSVHDPEILPAVMERWTSSIATGEPFEMTFPLRGADGRFRPFLTRVQPVRDASGIIVRWFGVNTEISQQAAAEEQLRRNHDTFYNLIQNDPFGVYVVDADFRLAVVSDGSRKVFESIRPLIGRDFAEILRMVWQEPFASDAIARFRHTLETGEPYASARTVERRGNVDRVEAYDWRIQRIALPDGRYGVVCYFYDLSERQQWEQALAESEARFREVANAAPVLIWVADTKNRGIWYNKAWLDFTGRAMEQELGDGWIENVHPDDLERCARICGGSFDRREPFRLDFRLRRADGEWRIIDDSGVPRFSEDGEFLGYIGSCIDVTDARRSEAALRESEERFRRIFEQTSDLILTADLDQVITDCNPAAATAVGASRNTVIGRKISDFVSPEDFARTTQMLQQKLEKGGTTRYDVRVRSSTGDWLFWEVNSGLTFDDSGNPVGLHVVGRDVTERKRFERHQRLLVGELNHRVKNTLSIVQSLAHQTFAKGVPPGDAITRFEGRLQALAAAHNLLTRQNWESASIRDVVTEALAPFCSSDRCGAEGPELRLPPKTAVSLALAMHELATNASKYGAMSNGTGRVDVSWWVDGGSLELLWCETGGPPVAPPSRTGFGSRMIKRSLAAEFGGEVELRFEATGVTCRVFAPVPVVDAVA